MEHHAICKHCFFGFIQLKFRNEVWEWVCPCCRWNKVASPEVLDFVRKELCDSQVPKMQKDRGAEGEWTLRGGNTRSLVSGVLRERVPQNTSNNDAWRKETALSRIGKTLCSLVFFSFVFLSIVFTFRETERQVKLSVPCHIDGKNCQQKSECSSCKTCTETSDRCCCRHQHKCDCVEPTTGELCCSAK